MSFSESENPGKGYPKTGGFTDVDPVAASLIVLVICAATGAAASYFYRTRKQVKAIDEMEKEMLGESKDE